MYGFATAELTWIPGTRALGLSSSVPTVLGDCAIVLSCGFPQDLMVLEWSGALPSSLSMMPQRVCGSSGCERNSRKGLDL